MRASRWAEVLLQPAVQRAKAAPGLDDALDRLPAPQPARGCPGLRRIQTLVPKEADARMIGGIAARRCLQCFTADVVTSLLHLSNEPHQGAARSVVVHRVAESLDLSGCRIVHAGGDHEPVR